MSRRKRSIIAAGALLLTLALALLLLNTTILRDLVAPLIYAIVVTFGQLLNTLPQQLLWILFMLFVLQTVLMGLMGFVSNLLQKRRRDQEPPLDDLRGPVERYARWIAQSNDGKYFRFRLAHFLSRLTLRTLDEEWQQSIPQIERRLGGNTDNMPPQVADYLHSGLRAREDQPAGNLERLRQISQNVIDAQQADYSDIERTLDYLESRLAGRVDRAPDSTQ